MINIGLVREYMTKELITFKPDDSVDYIIDTIIREKISGATVLNEHGEIVGLISEKDCMAVVFGKFHEDLSVEKAVDIMKRNVETVTENTSIQDVAIEFINKNFRRFPVVDQEGKLVGQISCQDVLRAIQEHR